MSECRKVFIVDARLVKLGKGRIGFYIPKRHQKEIEEYLGCEATLIICIHPKIGNNKGQISDRGKEADWLLLTMAKFKAGTWKALETAKQGK